MVILSPRIHFFEIGDQDWFSPYLREKFQSALALFWSFRIPLIQNASPAQFAARTICRIIDDPSKYVYVDFCAGAGGPIPTIEQELNSQLKQFKSSSNKQSNGTNAQAKFILTDLHPHIPDWTKIAKRTENITFIKESVNAADAPLSAKSNDKQKVFRLYNLAFHHFDDKLASSILRNTLETADGFGIFELQHRTFSSILTITAVGLVLFLITPFFFWRSPGHLFFTYLVPIIPFVIMFDGYVSSFRTRTMREVMDLVNNCGASSEDWIILNGEEQHAWPIGYMSWIIAVKKGTKSQ